MHHSVEVKAGEIFKDKSGLVLRVERVDPNCRIRFSVVDDHHTAAGPGEMSQESFVSRFSPTKGERKPHIPRKRAA